MDQAKMQEALEMMKKAIALMEEALRLEVSSEDGVVSTRARSTPF